ncbi:hypothetical protein VTJ83DRAFT_3995 [Remersonia thermophila]|uniref:Uncharacterized protein n=1 Tax=Remersonia thermophila TaxID=72144 RepID=A0ABR4DGH7_9PEZI
MLVKYLVPALAAFGSAAAQAGTCTVSGGTTTVNSQAEATKLASCRTVRGSVVLGKQTGAAIDISGPQQITGDLRVEDNGDLETLSSSTLTSVGGAFVLKNVTKINAINFSKLTSVRALQWQSLSLLSSITLGPLSSADEVTISDTVLQSLEGIDLTNVKKFNINNNRRLQQFSSKLATLDEELIIQANGIGLGLTVDLPNLVWAANMAIANVTKFSVPSLKVVNGSARFDSNFFESFSAPNLTHTEKGDISFVGNAALNNLTFPRLTVIGGGLLVANNTALDEINAFSKLERVGGAIKLRGNFTEVEFPALNTVEGAVDISSTADIRDTCEELSKFAPANQGGDGTIAGVFSCTANNANANDDIDGDTSDSGNIDGKDDENSAAGMAFNSALLGLVAVAGFAAAL